MTEKSRDQIRKLEVLKSRTIKKIYGIKDEELVTKKEVDYRKIFIIFFKFIILLIFISLIFSTAFFSTEYKKIKQYVRSTREEVRLGKEYKIELEKREIKEKNLLKYLKDLDLNNINNLPDSKKILMLNIIPSGSPLTKTIKITSPFGMRLHPISKKIKMHKGLDMRLNIGDDILSTSTGKVGFAGIKQGYGKTVVIKNIYGFETFYAHLDKIYVKNGDIVGKGKVIAAGGNTGRSTGPHLHYEIRYEGRPIDSRNFINWNKDNFDIIFRKEKNVPWDYFLTIMGKN